MVMSISVALYGVSGHQPGHVIVARDLAFSWAQAEQLAEYQIAHQAGIRAMAFDMVRKGQVGIPEQAEQPVVEAELCRPNESPEWFTLQHSDGAAAACDFGQRARQGWPIGLV